VHPEPPAQLPWHRRSEPIRADFPDLPEAPGPRLPEPVAPRTSAPVPPTPRATPLPTGRPVVPAVGPDDWSPASARQAREDREQAERAKDQSDELWLRDLSRPPTPQRMFAPGVAEQTAPSTAAPPVPQDRHPFEEQYPTAGTALRQDPGSGWTAGHPSVQPTAKPRLVWIDTARGLAIVLVVLLHATDWIQETAINIQPWDDMNEVINTLRMPLFFMCAGILATKWLYAAWADLIAKKAFFLGWLYLLWQVVGSLEAIVAAQITGDRLTPLRMLVSLASSPVRPRFELWFIWALALFFLLARYCSRFPLGPQLSAAGLVAAVAFSSLVPQVNLGWNGFVEYYLFFLIGCYYRPLLLVLARRLTPPLSGVLVTGWLALTSITYVTGLINVPGIGIMVRLLGLVAGVAVAVLLQKVRVFSYLGSRTLQVYLAHTPIIVVLVFGLNHVATTGPVQALKWVLPLVFTAAAVGLALLLHAALIRTPAKLMYEPPSAMTERVRHWVARRPAGPENLHPTEVPGLQQRPLERPLERVLA